MLTYLDILNAVHDLTFDQKVDLRDKMRAEVEADLQRMKREEQDKCPHVRVETSEYLRGIVIWRCRDCGLTRREAHYRERGGR